MRMRKKKNGEKRLEACREMLLALPATPRADGAGDFPGSGPLHLEVGCGKGAFACEMAARNPDVNFVALERVNDVLLLAAEKAIAHAGERPRDNLRLLLAGADDLPQHFAPGSLDCIYLNFSDPWPKKGYAKRRLTHRRYLRMYFSLLREGGLLRFKTDNVGLFDFTLEELDVLGWKPCFVTRDLHRAPEGEGNVMTEYETNFSSQGIPICSLWVRRVGTLREEAPTPDKTPDAEER